MKKRIVHPDVKVTVEILKISADGDLYVQDGRVTAWLPMKSLGIIDIIGERDNPPFVARITMPAKLAKEKGLD